MAPVGGPIVLSDEHAEEWFRRKVDPGSPPPCPRAAWSAGPPSSLERAWLRRPRPALQRLCGIDNWKIETDAPPRLSVSDEIRAETLVTTAPYLPPPVEKPHVEARPPASLSDRADSSGAVAATQGSAGARSRASLAGGLGAMCHAQGPFNVGTPTTLAFGSATRASHIRRFAAQTTPPGGSMDLDVLLTADGSLKLRNVLNITSVNPPDSQVLAGVLLDVRVHRFDGSVSGRSAYAVLRHANGQPSMHFEGGTPTFQSAFAFTPAGAGRPTVECDYLEFLSSIASDSFPLAVWCSSTAWSRIAIANGTIPPRANGASSA